MTRLQNLRQFGFVCSMLTAAACFLAAEEEDFPELFENRGVSVSNPYFEVLAEDMLSAQYVAMVGELLGDRFSRMLPAPDGALRPVLVKLIPVADTGQATSFNTRIYRSGQVNVTISWGAATTRETVERALAQGLLTYLSGAYAKGSVNVPLWLELALQELARVQAVPSHGRFLAREVSRGGPRRLEAIVSVTREEDVEDEMGAYSYWLLTFLEREGRGRAQVQNFLIRILRGEAPLVAMNAAYGEHLRSASEAEMWWLVGLNEMLRARGSPILSTDESRRRVKGLSRFAFKGEDGDLRLFADDLWEHRRSARLQNEVQRRRQMAGLELSAIHPYYHNVLLSLDRVFEAVLSAEEEEYREALVAFQHDLRAGDELAEDTASILDDLSAELGR